MAITRQAAIAIALQEQAMMPLQASGEEGASAPHRIQADLMTYRDAWQELFVDDQVMAELSSEAKDGALVWLITLDGFWGDPSSFNRGEDVRYRRMAFMINANTGELEGRAAFR